MKELFDGLVRHVEAGLEARDPRERAYHLRHAMQYIEGMEFEDLYPEHEPTP